MHIIQTRSSRSADPQSALKRILPLAIIFLREDCLMMLLREAYSRENVAMKKRSKKNSSERLGAAAASEKASIMKVTVPVLVPCVAAVASGSPLAFLYMMDEELMIVCGQKKQGLALWVSSSESQTTLTYIYFTFKLVDIFHESKHLS